jgi:hypothetical protein
MSQPLGLGVRILNRVDQAGAARGPALEVRAAVFNEGLNGDAPREITIKVDPARQGARNQGCRRSVCRVDENWRRCEGGIGRSTARCRRPDSRTRTVPDQSQPGPRRAARNGHCRHLRNRSWEISDCSFALGAALGQTRCRLEQRLEDRKVELDRAQERLDGSERGETMRSAGRSLSGNPGSLVMGPGQQLSPDHVLF